MSEVIIGFIHADDEHSPAKLSFTETFEGLPSSNRLSLLSRARAAIDAEFTEVLISKIDGIGEYADSISDDLGDLSDEIFGSEVEAA